MQNKQWKVMGDIKLYTINVVNHSLMRDNIYDKPVNTHRTQ